MEDDDDIALLNEIQCEYASDIDTCCTKMFQLWLQKQRVASWGQLIKCLRQPYVNLHELASKIEQIISESPSSGNFYKIQYTHIFKIEVQQFV